MSLIAPDDPRYQDAYGAAIDRLTSDPTEWPCARCGQLAAVDPHTDSSDAHICASCRQRDREPQGETVRLFQPAPTVPPGSTTLF